VLGNATVDDRISGDLGDIKLVIDHRWRGARPPAIHARFVTG
jgi:hypothetical protein